MSQHSSKSIIHKTIKIGSSTMVSRILGVMREILMLRYFGIGMLSDAFLTGFLIPNTLRKIFAEGALSAAIVPEFIKSGKNNTTTHSLMSLGFIVFEGILLILCALVMLFPAIPLAVIAPGFSPEQIALTKPFVRLLMPFIFFVSSSALLAGALQSVGHFFAPAFGPILLNIFFIMGLIICSYWQLPAIIFCFFVLGGGLVQLIHHIITYFRLGFSFGPLTKSAWKSFARVMVTFLVCFLSMSVVEIGLVIDRQFASYLPQGSISLIYYANRFMGIPLGVFATALSTILLPQFSRLSVYAPKRLGFYLLESAKLIVWVTLPISLLMSFFASSIFQTFSSKLTPEQVNTGGYLLIIFVSVLFFFSFNKIILNVYYASQAIWAPVFVSLLVTVLNVALNMLLIKSLGLFGLALATSICTVLQTFLLLLLLGYRVRLTRKSHTILHFLAGPFMRILVFRKIFYFIPALQLERSSRMIPIKIYMVPFASFLSRYLLQLSVVSGFFYGVFQSIVWLITATFSASLSYFFLYKIGLWLWVAPLCLLFFLVLWKVKQLGKLPLYFVD